MIFTGAGIRTDQESSMDKQPLSGEMEKLLGELKVGGLAFRRLEAIEKIGKLGRSHPQVVLALLRIREKDGSEEVRRAAAEALRLPLHADVLEKNPDLTQLAQVEEEEVLPQSVFGLISFALAMLSIVIVYLDIFVLSSQPAGAANPAVDISPLFCLSFLLSIVGLVFGIIGVRQYGRVKLFSRLGLLGNALIIICTLILTMVIQFKIT
jgi:hypothetical protein